MVLRGVEVSTLRLSISTHLYPSLPISIHLSFLSTPARISLLLFDLVSEVVKCTVAGILRWMEEMEEMEEMEVMGRDG